MIYEADPLKQLTCYISFDPALDREGMGKDYGIHFGSMGSPTDTRYGNREVGLVKTLPGRRASTFIIRPLRSYERAQCDSLPTAESRWLRAFATALVRAELCAPLSTTNEAVFGSKVQGVPGIDEDGLDYIAERVSIEAIYEIGAVAYSRSQLGFTGRGYAPLPVTSVLALVQRLQYHADTLDRERSSTMTTSADSISAKEVSPRSEGLGGVAAPMSQLPLSGLPPLKGQDE